MNKNSISIIVPVHNEENRIENNIVKLYNYLRKLKLINEFEILVRDNGNRDKTYSKALMSSESYPKIGVLKVRKRLLR